MTNPIESLHQLGQSIWYDNIERRLLENGGLAAMINRGDIRGITSNPSIFQNAIAKSHDYDSALVTMAWAGYSTADIFDQLALEDIRAAADLFLPLYEHTHGGDGYVSLEVTPTLAHDTPSTLAEARRLWQSAARPNVMIKIPATKQGLPAIRQALSEGININITLIFSLQRYQEVMEAYLSGLEDRLAAGGALGQIASVASFFVSRMDTKVDSLLEAIIQKEGAEVPQAAALRGKSAIANARLAYQLFRQVFSSLRFERLRANGARLQRPLWASTSTKNPAYPDTLYVAELIGPDTVNTMPTQTLQAFSEHGVARLSLAENPQAAQQTLDQLGGLGISVDQVTDELEAEGVKAFAEASAGLLSTIEERRRAAKKELGPLAEPVVSKVQELDRQYVVERIHAHDPTVWTEDPAGQAEIRKRLGWLDLPSTSRLMLPELEAFRQAVLAAGLTHVLLLGMGGSSLAPEVLRLVNGKPSPGQGLDLRILDATDPAQVRAAARWSPVERTLYIVSSKSGGTAEVNAYLDYFWARAKRKVGGRAGEHFVVITDPDTSLGKLARQRNFRRVFLADPAVGGRFSGLTAFGLVPAALLGLDVSQLLERADWMRRQCAADIPAGRNPGLVLGAVMGQAALLGRDKLTLIADPGLESFGSWLEQLIAESSGKLGKGIVPVDGETLARPALYGKDRLFVYLRRQGKFDRKVEQLRKKGQPVLQLPVTNNADLGVEFYRWEFAIAVACAILGVNAFDQPDVQDNKTRTVNRIQAYQQSGKFDEGTPTWEGDGVRLFGFDLPARADLTQALQAFLKVAHAGDYIALNAYLPRNRLNQSLLRKLRTAIRQRTGLATTVGFGPRFLHSTGQLHKGGANNGVFLQITADPAADLPIPEEGLTFATLERAQSLGDLEALQARGRRVLRVHLGRVDILHKLIV